MKPITLITGATAGIGKAIAEEFAAHGHDLILTGRRQEKLTQIASSLREKGNRVLELCFDVRNREDVETHLGNLPPEWQKIDILVNNAGLAAGREPIHEGDPDDWDTMIDTNIKGLLYVTRVIGRGMVERQSGHIINIGSIAGKEIYPDGNVYCGTKFAVDAISRATRIDLVKFGIKVTAINPGMVETEFSMVRFKGNEDKAKAAYRGYTPLYAEDIARVAWFAASQPPHVCLNDITLTCTRQADARIIIRDE
ncbi:MAG: SDR family NAD(P)-dependent oxidoreductase [Bacteroidia bacterium]|nr:SDR family NAD(P)-dependent oxidoreductase [Bacteroidia bacterium]